MDSQSPFESIFNIRVESNAQNLLATAVKWAKITAILGFVSAGLSLLSLFFGAQRTGGQFAGFVTGFGLFFMIPILAATVILNIFLIRFANHTAEGMQSMNQNMFNQGISQLRYYFKTLGILIIIAVAICILMIFVFLIGFGLRG